MFKTWLLLQETSLTNLKNSAIEAFPNTTKRQHATDPIKIVRLEWLPYVGTKILFVKGTVKSDSGKEYNPVIVFQGVSYHKNQGEGIVEITATDGEDYFLEQLSLENTDVRIRCQCKDFYWRFHHYNYLDKSLFNHNRKPYEAQGLRPPINPTESEGMCKHLMKMMQVLNESNLVI